MPKHLNKTEFKDKIFGLAGCVQDGDLSDKVDIEKSPSDILQYRNWLSCRDHRCSEIKIIVEINYLNTVPQQQIIPPRL